MLVSAGLPPAHATAPSCWLSLNAAPSQSARAIFHRAELKGLFSVLCPGAGRRWPGSVTSLPPRTRSFSCAWISPAPCSRSGTLSACSSHANVAPVHTQLSHLVGLCAAVPPGPLLLYYLQSQIMLSMGYTSIFSFQYFYSCHLHIVRVTD